MRRRRRTLSEVELNLAAMLDMAFQLLAFFILTFQPSPIEGQVSLMLPQPKPVTVVQSGRHAGADTSDINPVQGLDSLIITVIGEPSGRIGSVAIGEMGLGTSLTALDDQLKEVLGDPGSPFEQIIIQVGSDLRYAELMGVIDICTRQKLPNGQKLTKLSFVELPNAPPGQ